MIIKNQLASLNVIGSFNNSLDWRMPMVIAPRTEESLVNGPSNEGLVDYGLNACFLRLKHMFEWITALLEPELVSCFDSSWNTGLC